MKVSFSIPAVLSTLLSTTLGAAVHVQAAKDLSKRRETCGTPGGCPGFVLGNYYVNVRLPLNCLTDSTGGSCVFGRDWIAADGTRYTDFQEPHCDPATPCTGATKPCTWVAGNQYANCL